MLKIQALNTCTYYLRGDPAVPPTPKFSWPSWDHVGTIFRSWGLLGAFGASCCVFCRSGLVFVDLGPLLGRFWKVSGGSGKGFGGPRASFFEFFLRVRASNAKKLVMCKNHNFS